MPRDYSDMPKFKKRLVTKRDAEERLEAGEKLKWYSPATGAYFPDTLEVVPPDTFKALKNEGKLKAEGPFYVHWSPEKEKALSEQIDREVAANTRKRLDRWTAAIKAAKTQPQLDEVLKSIYGESATGLSLGDDNPS